MIYYVYLYIYKTSDNNVVITKSLTFLNATLVFENLKLETYDGISKNGKR
jgi:hypothetical protein